MDVQLYVYDLTRGMARSMSRQFLGIQIDAVYHTSLVFGNIEYFFGAGVQTCRPGATHHGQPMEIIPMGQTQLPIEVILEYLEGLKEIYTPESYDLFAHNCNNFTNDFGMFLVGTGIPDHITSLPKRVLETPFGQMLKPQIDASMRSITQAPVAEAAKPAATSSNGMSQTSRTATSAATIKANDKGHAADPYGAVYNVTSLDALDRHLQGARSTAASIFFTSSSCAPCKLAYPMFDQLAEQFPHALFVKVDINSARDVASRYQIRATPTFITFSRGSKHSEWQGADPNLLKANVEQVIQHTFPPHAHTLRKTPTLQFGSLKPFTFARVPPLDKLVAKLGNDASATEITSLRTFVERRSTDPKEATLPNLHNIGQFFKVQLLSLPTETRFAAVDLLRCTAIDERVSGFLAEETNPQTVLSIFEHVNSLPECPHNLRLVTLHLACNLFTSPLFSKELLNSARNDLPAALVSLITASLLDTSHPSTRVAAASLAFNLAVSNYKVRREEGREGLAEAEQVALGASLIETLQTEDDGSAAKTLLLAFGFLIYCAPIDGELLDLCKVLDAKGLVGRCKGEQKLKGEIVQLL